MVQSASLFMRLLQLALLPWLGEAFASQAGSCSGPAAGHSCTGAACASTATISAPATAQPGALVDVTLSHTDDFKGFLLKADGGATASEGYPPGTQRMTCSGFSLAAAHDSAVLKNDLTFSVRMPCSPGSVTVSGYLVLSFSNWLPLDPKTITVAGAAACLTCAGFDCSSDTNDLAAAPDGISCGANGCAASECCTVARPPPPPAGSESKQLAPGVLMAWTVAGDDVTIEVTFDGSGWISLGRAEQAGAMIGGEALIGQPGSGVAWYSMSTKELSGVTRTGATVQTGSNIVQIDGKTVLTTSWPTGAGAQQLLWAVGSSNTLSVVGHGGSLRGGMLIDFVTGDTKSSVNHKKHIAMIIHGGLMMLGWGILLPFGILSSVYRSRIADGAGGIWLKYHARLQVGGVILGSVAVIIPWWVMDAGTPWSSPQRPTVHAPIGYALTVYSVLQLLLGKLRPPATKDGEEPTIKRRTWEKMHKYSGRTAMLVALWQLVSGSWLTTDFIRSDSGGEGTVWLACLGGVLVLDIGAALWLSPRGLKVSRQQQTIGQVP